MKRRILRKRNKSYRWIYDKLSDINDSNDMLIHCDTEKERAKLFYSLTLYISRNLPGKYTTIRKIHTNDIYVTLNEIEGTNGNSDNRQKEQTSTFPRTRQH